MKSRANELAGVCGYFCGSCDIYKATQDDPELLKHLAKQFGLSVEEVSCNGCRSEERGHNCERCEMFNCAWDKGKAFCHECSEYPCAKVELFLEQTPPRKGLWQNIARIQKVGCDAWIRELAKKSTSYTHDTSNSTSDFLTKGCVNS